MYLCIYVLYEWEKTSSHLNKMKTITTKNLWAIVIMMKNSLGDYKNFLVFAWQCLFGWILNEICEFGFIEEKTLHKCLSACLSNIWCWHFWFVCFLKSSSNIEYDNRIKWIVTEKSRYWSIGSWWWYWTGLIWSIDWFDLCKQHQLFDFLIFVCGNHHVKMEICFWICLFWFRFSFSLHRVLLLIWFWFW